MSDRRPSQILTEKAARVALSAACSATGLEFGGAALLGPVADNAVFGLPGRVVARVSLAETGPRAAREVLIGRWLAGQGLPAVLPLETIEQPLAIRDHVVTFWHEITGGAMASTAELGHLLRKLHHLSPPSDFELWPLEPFVRLEDHLADAAAHLPVDEVAFLSGRLAALQQQYERVVANLPASVIHGDANRKNVMRASDGQVVLLDLERFSLGPREWDLAVPAVYRRLGWYSSDEYAAFVHAYGRDITEWDGFEVFASLREFRMTAWLVARLGREPRFLPEAQRRIASLHDPASPRSWTPGS